MALFGNPLSPQVRHAHHITHSSVRHVPLWCRPSTVCLMLLITSISFLSGYSLRSLGMDSLVIPAMSLLRGSSKMSPTTHLPSSPSSSNIIECPGTGSINMSYYQSGDSFQRAIAYGIFKPMRVYEEAKEICDGPRVDKMNRNESSPKHWKYCLPLWGNRNASECASATRNILLDPRVLKPVCASAVLDILTHDVYRTMEEVGCNPMLTFGTALGALRNGSHIPWTEDVDLAYFTSADEGHSCVESDEFSSILRSRGYFTFKHHIWRVCMTSDHPLAGQVYDISFRNGDKRSTHLCMSIHISVSL